MATRFYCPSNTAASVSPAFGSAWTTTGAALRRRAVTAKLGEAMTTLNQAANASGTDNPILYLQYVTDALAATMLLGTGTLNGVFRIGCSNVGGWTGGASLGISFRLAKCANDGSSVIEIVSYSASATTLAAALTNNRFKVHTTTTTPVPIGSDVTINANDRLILEVGLEERTTNTGRTGDIRYGDAAGADLADDDTSTTDNDPWFEFSQNLSFAGAGGRTTRNTRATGFGMELGMNMWGDL